MERVSKAALFAHPTAKEIDALIAYQADQPVSRPQASKLIESLTPEMSYRLQMHLLPSFRRRSQGFMRHGPVLALPASDTESIATLLEEILAKNKKETGRYIRDTVIAGISWPIPGTTNGKAVLSLDAVHNGTFRYWYHLNKYPEATEENKEALLREGVRIYGHQFPARAHIGEVYATVKAPSSKIGAKNYIARVDSIPWFEKGIVGRIGRGVRFEGDVSESKLHRGKGVRKPSRIRYEGNRMFLFPEDVAMMLLIADYAKNELGNTVPAQYLPLIMPSEDFMNHGLTTAHNVWLHDSLSGAGRLRESDREIIHWGYVYNHGFEGMKPSGKIKDYNLWEFFTRRKEQVYSSSEL